MNFNIQTWTAPNGLISDRREPKAEEYNSVLWTSNYLMFQRWLKMTPQAFYPREASCRQWFFALGEENQSHDNTTGLIADHYDAYGTNILEIPIASIRRPHPRDIIFYGLTKEKWWAKVLTPLLSLICIWSCLDDTKYREIGGKTYKILKTDGQILGLMRCKALGMNRTLKIMSYIIRKNKNFGSWHQLYKTYFKAEGHPLPIMVKELEARGEL